MKYNLTGAEKTEERTWLFHRDFIGNSLMSLTIMSVSNDLC